MIEDFPALGRPTTAKRGIFSSISGSDFLVKRFNISSNKSPVPEPLAADTQKGSPSPNE